jgi:hypothetical protein
LWGVTEFNRIEWKTFSGGIGNVPGNNLRITRQEKNTDEQVCNDQPPEKRFCKLGCDKHDDFKDRILGYTMREDSCKYVVVPERTDVWSTCS